MLESISPSETRPDTDNHLRRLLHRAYAINNVLKNVALAVQAQKWSKAIVDLTEILRMASDSHDINGGIRRLVRLERGNMYLRVSMLCIQFRVSRGRLADDHSLFLHNCRTVTLRMRGRTVMRFLMTGRVIFHLKYGIAPSRYAQSLYLQMASTRKLQLNSL